MAPPLFFLLFVIVVLFVAAAIALFGVRAGLWVKETDPDDTLKDEPEEERFGRRPEHVEVDDPGRQTTIGT